MSIPPNLHNRLHTILLRCEAFESDRALRAVFADARIDSWRHRIPHADSPDERAKKVVDYLHRQADKHGGNALVLLLRVLSEQMPHEDTLRQELATLADELSALRPPPPPPPPLPWKLITIIAGAVLIIILGWAKLAPSSNPTPTRIHTPTYTASPTFMPGMTPSLTQTFTSTATPPPAYIPTITPPPSPPDPCMKEEKNGNGGIDTITLPGDECYGNRIRIDLLVRGTINGFSFWEVQAYGPDDSEMRNPLITKEDTTCTSSIEDDNPGYYHPGKAIDADPSSRWSSYWHEPECFVIILSEPKHIKSIVVTWQEAFALKYRVTVSNEDNQCPYELP